MRQQSRWLLFLLATFNILNSVSRRTLYTVAREQSQRSASLRDVIERFFDRTAILFDDRNECLDWESKHVAELCNGKPVGELSFRGGWATAAGYGWVYVILLCKH